MEKTEKLNNTKPAVVKTARKRKSGATAAIITLSILLGVSLVAGLTAAFFGATNTAKGDITLGDPVNVAITQNATTVTALTFSGTAMPGTVYDQVIGISAPANTSDGYVRAKLTLANTNTASANVEATVTDDWTLGDDDYYYYNGTMSAGDTADFVSQITVPTSLTNADANKVYTITVQVESIQTANNAVTTAWTTAPATWVSSYVSA